ncbi:MAG: hypothetical protein QM640_05120 [Niabella sp.]
MKYWIICGLLLCISCGTGSKPVTAAASAFILKVNEKQKTGELLITLKEIKESRCPMNARCIRAGEAVAVLNVVIGNKSERNIQLCAGPDCDRRGLSEVYTLSAENQKYLFRLDSITPDPTRTLEKTETKVYFTVDQK